MLKSMLARLRETQEREFEGEEAAEAGFTLIELMVVLLIIAILLAIAIPTFLGVTGSANDRAAQSNLTNGLTEAKALYQNQQSYATANLPLTSFQASAPEFGWIQGAGATGNCTVALGPNCMSETPVDVASLADGGGVILANLSKTGTCWYTMSLEATPVAQFAPVETAPLYQAVSGTAGPGDQENSATPVAALTTAGTYYSQVAKAVNNGGCNATIPASQTTNTTGWKWGSSFPTAPQS
jgi:type IV pilus assembly protein PilA